MKHPRLLLLCLVFALLLSSGVQGQNSLIIGIHSDENNVTPYSYVTGYPGYELLGLIYDTLLILDGENVPQPWLAQSWTVGDEGNVYTLTLAEASWQDGRPLTAEDVAFSYTYYAQHPHSRWSNPASQIEEIIVHSPREISFVLPGPRPEFPYTTLAELPIIPRHIWEGVAKPEQQPNSLGSGPYKLEEYVPDQYYRFRAHQGYFAGQPAFDELLLPIIKDPNTLYTALMTGDIAYGTRTLTPELVARFSNHPGLDVVTGPGFTTILLAMDVSRPPLNQRELRQAIELAIDQGELVDRLLLGYGTEGSRGFLHPASPYADEELAYRFDPQRAASLLDEAGFPRVEGSPWRKDPDGQELVLGLLVPADDPIRLRTGELIKEWLEEIGIRVDLRALEGTTLRDLVWQSLRPDSEISYDMVIWGWSAPMQTSPFRLADLFGTGGAMNIQKYSSPAFDAAAQRLAGTTDGKTQAELILKLQGILAEDLPVISLFHQNVLEAYAPGRHAGWQMNNGRGIFHKGSLIKR
ncbi:MAG: ABC transporter substrate-binding protein [Limnochordia bacterium]